VRLIASHLAVYALREPGVLCISLPLCWLSLSLYSGLFTFVFVCYPTNFSDEG
jgi:hypothetical protein